MRKLWCFLAAGLGLTLAVPPLQTPLAGNPAAVAAARSGPAWQDPTATHAFERAALEVWGLNPFGEAEAAFSPVSLWFSLGLSEVGAGAPSSDLIYRFFSVDKDDYRKILVRQRRELQEAVSAGVMTSASALWVQPPEHSRGELQPSYLARVRALAGDVRTVNFHRPVEAAREINGWVSAITGGRIAQILAPAELREAQMVLGSAVVFRSPWAHPFSARATSLQPFYPENRPFVSVPTMHTTDFFRCLLASQGELNDFSLVELDFSQTNWALDILLPSPGLTLSQLENRLTQQRLSEAIETMQVHRVTLSLPRFRVRSRSELRPPLARLGLSSLFSEDADFSGLFALGIPPHISKIVQEVDVAINEQASFSLRGRNQLGAPLDALHRKDSEAQAAGEKRSQARVEAELQALPQVLNLDRPFLFIIRHRQSGTFLLLGRYCGVSASGARR